MVAPSATPGADADFTMFLGLPVEQLYVHLENGTVHPLTEYEFVHMLSQEAHKQVMTIWLGFGPTSLEPRVHPKLGVKSESMASVSSSVQDNGANVQPTAPSSLHGPPIGYSTVDSAIDHKEVVHSTPDEMSQVEQDYLKSIGLKPKQI